MYNVATVELCGTFDIAGGSILSWLVAGEVVHNVVTVELCGTFDIAGGEMSLMEVMT